MPVFLSAWYQAAANVSATAGDNVLKTTAVTAPASLSTDEATYTVNVTLEQKTNATELVLAEYHAAGDAKRVGEGTYAAAGWNRFYRNAQGTLLEDTDGRTMTDGALYSKIWQVSVSIEGGPVTGDDLADLLDKYAAYTVSVSFSNSGTDDVTIGTKVYASATEAADFMNDLAPFASNTALSFTWGDWDGTSKKIGYVQVYADGDDYEDLTQNPKEYTDGNLSFQITATVGISNS